MENHEMYKTRKEVKKIVSDATSRAYDDLYNKLREMKSRDFDHVKC